MHAHNTYISNARQATMQLHLMKAGVTQLNIGLEVIHDALHDRRTVASRTVPIGTMVPKVQVGANTNELNQAINS